MSAAQPHSGELSHPHGEQQVHAMGIAVARL